MIQNLVKIPIKLYLLIQINLRNDVENIKIPKVEVNSNEIVYFNMN